MHHGFIYFKIQVVSRATPTQVFSLWIGIKSVMKNWHIILGHDGHKDGPECPIVLLRKSCILLLLKAIVTYHLYADKCSNNVSDV